MKFQEFTFDLQRELEWISEKVTIVLTEMEIQTLQQAQSFGKKHKKLEEEVNNHSVVVDKVVESGKKLLSGSSYASEVIANTTNLTDAWNNLLTAIEMKGNQLKLILTAQQFFFEVAEVESWIGDKNRSMKGAEYGKDEDSSVELLTKHKAMELEINTYSGIVQEISAAATKLINNNHPDAKLIKTRDDVLRRDFKNLKKVRRDRLVAAIQLHEYNRESGQFLTWIREMMVRARSEDTGQDYEHLEILLARFQEFKLRVQAGEDKFSTCENLAKTVDKDLSDLVMKEVQATLTEEWRSLIEAIEERDKKLESAREMHRINRLLNLERMDVYLSQRASSLLLGRELRLKYWPWMQESLINLYTSKYRVEIIVVKRKGDIQDVSISRKGKTVF